MSGALYEVANDTHLLGSVFKLLETPWEMKLPAPLLGQHNEKVYCDLLGYSKQQLASLTEEGMI